MDDSVLVESSGPRKGKKISWKSLRIHSVIKQIFIELLVCVKDYIKCLIYMKIVHIRTRRSLPLWGLRYSREDREYIEHND